MRYIAQPWEQLVHDLAYALETMVMLKAFLPKMLALNFREIDVSFELRPPKT